MPKRRTRSPRTRRRKRTPCNMILKTAILTISGTQRKFARDKGWPEIRLSEIIHGRQYAPTPDEVKKLVRQLGIPADVLFPPKPDPAAVAPVPVGDDVPIDTVPR